MPSRTALFRRAPFVSSASKPFAAFAGTGPGVVGVFLELAVVGFVAAGVAAHAVGSSAPWFLLAVAFLGLGLRAVDLENCALFIPGGVYGAAKLAFGRTAGRFTGAIVLVEHVVFGALMASAAGRAMVAFTGLLAAVPQTRLPLALGDISTAVAALLIGIVWLGMRQGRAVRPVFVRRAAGWAGAAILAFVVAHGLWAWLHFGPRLALPLPNVSAMSPVGVLMGLGACLFVLGSPDALGRASGEFPQPRIRNLRKAVGLVSAYLAVITVGSGALFVALVPPDARDNWFDTPLAGIAWFDGLPLGVSLLLFAVVVLATAILFGLASQRSAVKAQELLLRLSEDGIVPAPMRAMHPRYGTPSRLIDLLAVGQLATIVASALQLTWLAQAYGIVIAMAAVVKMTSLIALRTQRPETRAFRVGLNVRLRRREWPVGLVLLIALVGIPALATLASVNVPALSAVGLVMVVAAALAVGERQARLSADEAAAQSHAIDLLAAVAIGTPQIKLPPGNVLVPVRRPGALAHLATALQSTDREVVVMTVRLVGIDASDEFALRSQPTAGEQRVLGDAAMLAERSGRAVRLLIVPATNVFDAVAAAAGTLQSSAIYVGESETLAASDQARLLGEAWERVPEPKPFDVRLIVRHSSGRTAEYHLGAHDPSLTSDDLHLIHDIWLDVVKTVGPHVHHHDVVRAALTHMKDELHDTGPARDAAVDLVRRIARPADELAAAVRQRDFGRLRDMVRNRPASNLAAVLTELEPEDQVVAYRVLPRRVAAATFEYLSTEQQQALLKAMAKEDIAAILNEMAPDDRTMFLEELPASATQQLLALLTPGERAIAATLLGYPEGSIGRLMTPDYIAVREDWTVQQALDYIRTHGQDSETLNVIYVVDDQGVLIDDIRIREILLTSPQTRIGELMDRRFVALNAADDQNAAVAVFKREDRSALPVTDSAGVLIGIVTIDDVLDVVEAATTKEIQRIGGSEALDEPYTEIAFGRMIQKRAGWLTALFLGEMLTATAMGAFEREIERAVVLALFVPLIISSGGNSGSQASTLVIRAIALGELQLKDWWRVMRREVAAGLALGSILGSIGFLRITVWSAFSNLYGEHWLLVAVTVALALVGVVLWGTLVGSLLPFLLRRLGFDPATSSAPFVATLVDVTGLIIYFSVGLVVLRGSLL